MLLFHNMQKNIKNNKYKIFILQKVQILTEVCTSLIILNHKHFLNFRSKQTNEMRINFKINIYIEQ